jgi:hypothetical protein
LIRGERREERVKKAEFADGKSHLSGLSPTPGVEEEEVTGGTQQSAKCRFCAVLAAEACCSGSGKVGKGLSHKEDIPDVSVTHSWIMFLPLICKSLESKPSSQTA